MSLKGTMNDLERIAEADPGRAWLVDHYRYRVYMDMDSNIEVCGDEIDLNPTAEGLANLIQARREFSQYAIKHRSDEE